MGNINKKFAKIMEYAIPSLIVLAVMTVVLVGKGIWPFGTNRIDYYDNMQQVAPLYSHLWDFLHGDADIWFDWYTGLGTNVSMSISAFSMLSPFNLILYFIPRNLILESISILTALKMVFMAVAMYLYINYKFKDLAYTLKVTFSVMFSLCGYVLLYGSCFTPWMDIVAFFPLLMMAYERMMESGKKLFYILMLALVFIINYYISAMSLVYIFVISGLYIFIKCEKTQRKDKVWNLGLATVAGLGLSAFVLLPVFAQLASSQRGNQGGGIISQYFGWVSSTIATEGAMSAAQRWLMFSGMSFALVLIIAGLKRYWSDKKKRNYNLAVIGVVVAFVLVEGVNLMWHFGSYCGYTLRNGFLLSFTFINIAAGYSKRLLKEKNADKKLIVRQLIPAVLIAVIFATGYNNLTRVHEYVAMFTGMGILIIMSFAYYLCMKKCRDEFNYKHILVFVGVELFVAAYALIGPPKMYDYWPFQYGDYVQTANRVSEELNIEASATNRITNPDLSLNANYPLVLKRGAMSSFTAALQADTQDWAYKLGYSKYFWWLLDSGGTVFTEALVHVTEAVNANRLDSELYTLKQSADGYSLYSSNYQLPFAVAVDKSLAGEDFNKDFISLHNIFYNALMPENGSIMNKIDVSGRAAYAYSPEYKALEYSADINGKQAVYVVVTDGSDWGNEAKSSKFYNKLKVYVNDEAVLVPTIGNLENTDYYHDYYNNLLYLGCYEDERITVRIEYLGDEIIDDSEVIVAALDMDKMDEMTSYYEKYNCNVSSTNNSLTVNLKGSSDRNMAMIPVVYSDNWKITVNGEAVNGEPLAGILTGVALNEGDNEIVMIFEPSGKKAGFIVTFVTALVIALSILINKIRTIVIPDVIKNAVLYIYTAIFAAVAVLMFAVPVLFAVPVYIYGMFGMIKTYLL